MQLLPLVYLEHWAFEEKRREEKNRPIAEPEVPSDHRGFEEKGTQERKYNRLWHRREPIWGDLPLSFRPGLTLSSLPEKRKTGEEGVCFEVDGIAESRFGWVELTLSRDPPGLPFTFAREEQEREKERRLVGSGHVVDLLCVLFSLAFYSFWRTAAVRKTRGRVITRPSNRDSEDLFRDGLLGYTSRRQVPCIRPGRVLRTSSFSETRHEFAGIHIVAVGRAGRPPWPSVQVTLEELSTELTHFFLVLAFAMLCGLQATKEGHHESRTLG